MLAWPDISVYNGNYNGANLIKLENPVLSSKISFYKLIVNPNIEEDIINLFCFRN